MHVQQDSVASEQRTRESLRTITGGDFPLDVSFRMGDLYAHYDRLRDEAIAASERKRNFGLKFCGDHKQVAECNQLHDEEVQDIRAAHARSIAHTQEMERRHLHALHETRDEAGEARNAARAMAGGEGAVR